MAWESRTQAEGVREEWGSRDVWSGSGYALETHNKFYKCAPVEGEGRNQCGSAAAFQTAALNAASVCH